MREEREVSEEGGSWRREHFLFEKKLQVMTPIADTSGLEAIKKGACANSRFMRWYQSLRLGILREGWLSIR